LDYDVWLRDLKQRYGSDPAFQATLPQYKEIADKVVAGDIKNWQGWFVHHGGQVEFLGDHVGAWSAAFQVVLVALFVGLAARVYQSAN
jgi:hypothetical protein